MIYDCHLKFGKLYGKDLLFYKANFPFFPISNSEFWLLAIEV